MRRDSVKEFASKTDKALQKCYSIVLMYNRSLSKTQR